MRTTLIASVLEAALIAFWVASFSGAIGTPHQTWYVVVPIIFLIVPVASIALAVSARNILDRGGWIVAFLLLICNFFAFSFYAMMSGGGV